MDAAICETKASDTSWVPHFPVQEGVRLPSVAVFVAAVWWDQTGSKGVGAGRDSVTQRVTMAELDDGKTVATAPRLSFTVSLSVLAVFCRFAPDIPVQ